MDLRDKVEAACKDYLSYLEEGSVIGGQIFKEEEEFLTLEQQSHCCEGHGESNAPLLARGEYEGVED